jgi:hypothetical protein
MNTDRILNYVCAYCWNIRDEAMKCTPLTLLLHIQNIQYTSSYGNTWYRFKDLFALSTSEATQATPSINGLHLQERTIVRFRRDRRAYKPLSKASRWVHQASLRVIHSSNTNTQKEASDDPPEPKAQARTRNKFAGQVDEALSKDPE